MVEQNTTPVLVQLPNNSRIRVEAVRAGDSDLEQDVSDVTRVFAFDKIRDAIQGIAEEVASALAQIKPKRATVEFGVDISLESGQLTAVLVKGSGTTSLKITLEWSSDATKT